MSRVVAATVKNVAKKRITPSRAALTMVSYHFFVAKIAVRRQFSAFMLFSSELFLCFHFKSLLALLTPISSFFVVLDCRPRLQ